MPHKLPKRLSVQAVESFLSRIVSGPVAFPFFRRLMALLIATSAAGIFGLSGVPKSIQPISSNGQPSS